jgi:hypothetical protein
MISLQCGFVIAIVHREGGAGAMDRREESKERRKRKRDFSSQKTLGGAEVSLRRATLRMSGGKEKIALLRSK